MKDLISYKNSNSNKWLALMLVIFMGVSFISCGEDPVSPDPEPEPEPEPNPVSVTASFSVDNEEPFVGDIVQVDGSGSSIDGEGTLVFSWTLSTPDGSTAELENADSETTSFEVDVPGEYEIILEVSADDANDTDSQTIEGLLPVEEISGTISEDLTLFREVLYRVVGDLTLNGATLTIEPGTVLEFEANTRMSIVNDGRLSAVGTEQDSIRFSGASAVPGYWDGIFIQDAVHPDNVLDYVVIEHGGGSALHSSVDPANLVIGRLTYSSNITVSNSVMRHGAGAGMFLHSNGALRSGSGNNTFTQNETGAVITYTNVMHYLDSQSSYSGNNNDRVYVYANQLDTDGTWAAIDVPYFMPGDHQVNNASLNIEAGALFEFDSEGSLHIISDVIFRALGEEGNEIVFTGSVKEAGWWDGIYIQDSRHPDGLMDHVIVEYAGAAAAHTSVEPANVTVGRSVYNARITISNSIMRNGGSYGLFVHSGGSIDGSMNNVYTENAEGPVKVYARNARFLDAGSDYSGNGEGNNFAWIISETVETDSNWDAINVPYGVLGLTRFSDATLTIEAGASIAFDTESRLEMFTGSIIEAIGTETDPITFTGTVETEGWWDGIFIYGTTHPNNAFDYVTIEYGGGRQMHTSVEPANLVIGRSVYPSEALITNSIIRNSADYGMYVHGDSEVNADACTENTFSGNAGPDCVTN